jgi:hypothetical protein
MRSGKPHLAIPFLSRAGLHLGVSTVGLILKEKPALNPTTDRSPPPKNITWLTLVSLDQDTLHRELGELASWYNRHRPHMTLAEHTGRGLWW